MIDDILVLYKNSDEYFKSYYSAYKNGQKIGKQRQVYYVFTPTMQEFKRVCELENCYRKYFRTNFSCSYFDFKNNTMIDQLNLFKEV